MRRGPFGFCEEEVMTGKAEGVVVCEYSGALLLFLENGLLELLEHREFGRDAFIRAKPI